MEPVQIENTKAQDKAPTQPESTTAGTEAGVTPFNRSRQQTIAKKIIPLIIIILVIAAGAISGFYLTTIKARTSEKSAVNQEELTPEVKQSFNQTFKDEAQGEIEKNDKLDKYAQGTHRLLRPGGESQTAYLTSSVLDLDEYVGKKLKVYGETFGSSQVGWLMDVGKVEVIQ